MTGELITVGVDLLAAIARLIMDAVAARDPSTLRKVGDVLPAGHVLKSRLALIEAKAAAEAELKPNS